MNNNRSITMALAVVAVIGLGSFAVSKQGLPIAAESPSSSGKHGEETEAAHMEEEQHDDEEGQLQLTTEQIDAAGIELAVAAPKVMSTSMTFPGEISFDEDRTTHVVPRVSGVVEAIEVDLGQPVKKGQVLAVIASPQISDQRAELNAAQRRVQLARLTLHREKKLWEDKISAEQDYLSARQVFQEADISLTNARQKLNAIGADPSASSGNRYELVAPFDAVVVRKNLGIGEVVNEASMAFTLSDLSRVWATFGVTPKDLNRVVVGRMVTVSAPDLQAQVQGRVSYVGNLLGQQTRSALVRVVLANPEGAWRPGLFVAIDVSAEQKVAAVSLPESSIQSVEDQPSVFVRNAQGFRLQPVTVGRRNGGYAEIAEGLAAGTQVAAAGSFILKSELGKSSAQHAH